MGSPRNYLLLPLPVERIGWKICQHRSETLNNLDFISSWYPPDLRTYKNSNSLSRAMSIIKVVPHSMWSQCKVECSLLCFNLFLAGHDVFQFCDPCVFLTKQYIILCKDVARCNLPRGMCILEHAKRSGKNLRMFDLHALRSEIDEKIFKS